MAAKKKSIESTAAPAPMERRIAWDPPYVPAKTVSGTIVQDVPAAEAARELVRWLRDQKLI